MIILGQEIYMGDTLPDVYVDEIIVVAKPSAYYQKLRRDVYKAYPFAIRAASIIEQIDDHKVTIDKKRHKKKYLKKQQKLLRENFEKDLRKLTKRQGRILVRLVHRETDNSVYELVKEYRNGLHARFWQTLAKKYDSDLKQGYEPDNEESEDFDIELIVESVEFAFKNRYLNEVEVDKPTYRDFQQEIFNRTIQ